MAPCTPRGTGRLRPAALFFMYLFNIYEIFLVSYIIIAAIGAVILIKRRSKTLAIILIISILGLIYSACVEPYWVKIRYQTVVVNKLEQPLRVAVVGDWHIRPGKGADFIKKSIQKIADLKPDLILMTGDFLFFDEIEKFDKDLASLGELSKIAPTFTVLGNHDYGIVFPDDSFLYADSHQEIAKILTDNGVKVLSDEQERVKIKGIELDLVGFDEYWLKSRDPEKAMAGLVKDNILKIGLSHHPDIAFDAIAANLDLVVAGHTHGGQIRLPLIGALGGAQSSLPRKDYGRYLADLRPRLFNTVGIGESGPPLRFLDRPEIALLEIK